jgi:NTE family protein
MRYIAPDEQDACRATPYYEDENTRFLREHPGHSPYVYNRQTLGLRLDTTQQIGLFRHGEPLQGAPIRNFTDYARALVTAVMNQQEKQHLKSDDWQRTVYINSLDVGATDFDISDEKKEALIVQGAEGAETYLQWFEGEGSEALNRIVRASVEQVLD